MVTSGSINQVNPSHEGMEETQGIKFGKKGMGHHDRLELTTNEETRHKEKQRQQRAMLKCTPSAMSHAKSTWGKHVTESPSEVTTHGAPSETQSSDLDIGVECCWCLAQA